MMMMTKTACAFQALVSLAVANGHTRLHPVTPLAGSALIYQSQPQVVPHNKITHPPAMVSSEPGHE
ncbi:hypothetical protein ACDQ55_20340 [Chitinophaga sp. 30R24]|uniref:hypothetical protein n=1 Tax=Chitinophaga sp. 30R24 TaxID=3248838 RepID=UPI003B8F6F97